MNETYEKILIFIEKSTDGKGFKRIASNGTKLYGQVKSVGVNAWFHEIFAPLDQVGLLVIEEKIGKSIPNSFREFLSYTNGIRLFSDEITIFGKRDTYKRSGDEDIHLPYSIVTPNTIEKPTDLKDSQIVIGSYSYNGSKVIIDCKDESILVCESENVNIEIYRANSFWDFLLSEIGRLSSFYNSEMVLIDDMVNTLPPNRLN